MRRPRTGPNALVEVTLALTVVGLAGFPLSAETPSPLQGETGSLAAESASLVPNATIRFESANSSVGYFYKAFNTSQYFVLIQNGSWIAVPSGLYVTELLTPSGCAPLGWSVSGGVHAPVQWSRDLRFYNVTISGNGTLDDLGAADCNEPPHPAWSAWWMGGWTPLTILVVAGVMGFGMAGLVRCRLRGHSRGAHLSRPK
jgi:hypothetical protein